MLGPFSIDTYLPAFTGIAQAIRATPVEMQQTLSAYLFGFAVMNLFHGALSDSFGAARWSRRPGRLHAGLGRLRALAAHRRARLLSAPCRGCRPAPAS
jgi:MFS family permease